MKKTNAVIFGAIGTEISYTPKESDLIIAADKGFKTLGKRNIVPDLILGDFDSLGSIPTGENVMVLPIEKDDTDMAFAVKYALDKGIRQIFILGGIGKRLDHSFANIQLLSYIKRCGGRGFLLSDNEMLTVISDESIKLTGKAGQRVSVFSLSEKSMGVCERGFKYTLDNAELSNGFPLGVSNELAGERGEISVSSGELLIYADGVCDFISDNRNCKDNIKI